MGDSKIPKIEREAQIWRVKTFEGMACKDFPDLFTSLQSSPIREMCETAGWYGNPTTLDEYGEVESVARLFEANNGPFRGLLTWSITEDDINHYHADKMEELMERNLDPKSPRGRPAILKGLRFETVDHPLARWVSQRPISSFHRWRGLPAFDTLAPEVAKLLTETGQRGLTMLYPAGGGHFPYLQTLFRLADQNQLDRAKVIVTELEVDGSDYTHALAQLFKAGLIDRMVTYPAVQFKEGDKDAGTEQTFYLRYKGVPIEIVLALNRSGEAYFRDDYLKQADVMIIHDCADGGRQEDSYQLLSEMLHVRRRVAPDRKQLVIMEGWKGSNDEWVRKPTLGYDPIAVEGPYGHCDGVDHLGEFVDCAYDTAHILRLDDSRLQARIHAASDKKAIFAAVYKPAPQVFMASPATMNVPLRPRK